MDFLRKNLDITDTNFGLRRFSFFAMAYAIFVICLSLVWSGFILWGPVCLFVIHSFLFYYSPVFEKKSLKQKNQAWIIVVILFGLAAFMWFAYESIGVLNDKLGGLDLYDGVMAAWDQRLFGTHVAHYFYKLTKNLGIFQTFLYEILVYSYFSYYLIPFTFLLFYFRQYQDKQNRRQWIRVVASIYILDASINLAYLVVPVTGPIYYVNEYWTYNLPFFSLGQMIYNFINRVHPNFIDCFPSGHGAMAYLMAYLSWYLRLKQRLIFIIVAVLMTFSTLFLRFHYTLDLIMAVVFVVGSHRCSYYLCPVEMKRPFAKKK